MPKWVILPRYGEFEIVGSREGRPRILGEGSFGKTFEAFREDSVAGGIIREYAALKVLSPELMASETKRFQFLQELSALTKLKHANLIHYIRCGEEQGQVYYAMELCRGGDLAGLVKRLGSIPEQTAALIGMQIATGLKEVHRQRLIHRDIKPSNVMLVDDLPEDMDAQHLSFRLVEQESLCRIVDFGLVDFALNMQNDMASLPRQRFVGSPMFASPEQICEQPVDGRSDIYSLGMTLWYLVQGKGPLLDASGQPLREEREVLTRHADPDDHRLPGYLSPGFRRLLGRLLAKKPERRLSSAVEAQNAIKEFLDEAPVSVRGGNFKIRKTNTQIDEVYRFIGKPLPLRYGMPGYMAEDAANGAPVRLLIVQDKETRPDPATVEDYRQQLISFGELSVQPDFPPAILKVVDVVESVDTLTCAEAEPPSTTLADVLRARGRSRPFAFREAAIVLEPIAEALGFLMQHGKDKVSLPCEEVYVTSHQLSLALNPATLARPLSDWADFQVFFSMLWFPQFGPSQNFDPTATMSWATRTMSGSMQMSESGSHPIRLFCRLVYRMMSGSEAAAAAEYTPHAYVPVVELSAASNNLLRDVLSGRVVPQDMEELFTQLCIHEALPRHGRGNATRSRIGTVGASGTGPRNSSIPAVGGSRNEPPPLPPSAASNFSPSHSASHSHTHFSEPPPLRTSSGSRSDSVMASVDHFSRDVQVGEVCRPGVVISPFDPERREIRVNADQWKPSAPLVCPYTQRPFRLPAKLDLLEATVLAPGVILSPFDPDGREIRLPWSDWQPSKELVCRVSGKRFTLPFDLPVPVGTIPEDMTQAAQSPYHTDGLVTNIPIASWEPGALVACPVTGLSFMLPSTLPPPHAVIAPNRPGEVGSPYAHTVKWQIEPPEWIAGSVLVCPATHKPLILPEEIMRWPAPEALVLDASKQEVSSPFAPGIAIKVPAALWRAGKRVDCPKTGRKVALPANLPPLMGQVIDGKVGVLRSPYTGKEVPIDIADWHSGAEIGCTQTQSKFQVPDHLPEWIPVGTLVPGKLGKVGSPFASGAVVDVTPGDWNPGQKLKCPSTGKTFQLPPELPPLEARVEPGKLGIVYSPYAQAHEIKVPVDDWTPGHRLTCPVTGKPILLPTPLTDWEADAEWVPRSPGRVLSPYGAHPEVEVSASEWKPGGKIQCPATKRIFRIPATAEMAGLETEKAAVNYAYAEPESNAEKALEGLKKAGQSKLTAALIQTIWDRHSLGTVEERKTAQETAELVPGQSGVVRSPYGGKPLVKVPAPQWVGGASAHCPETGRRFLLPGSLPPLSAVILPNKPGFLGTPYAEKAKPFAVSPDDWEPEKIVRCPSTGHPLYVPEDLPVWTPEAELVSGKAGSVISPFGSKSEIKVFPGDWQPGKVLRCPETGRNYKLPAELPPLQAFNIQGGTIETPYVPGHRFSLTAEQWLPGNTVACPTTGRLILLPNNLPEATWYAEIVSPGVVRSPFSTRPEVPIPGNHWNSGEKWNCPASGRVFTLPPGLPPLPAIILPGVVGKVQSPYNEKEIIEIAIGDWEPGHVIKCPASGRPCLLPQQLPLWEGVATLLPDKPGVVLSPYRSKLEISVSPDEWNPEQPLRCPNSYRNFTLPRNLPLLEGRVVNGDRGLVASPFAPQGEPQAVPAADWLPGKKIRCEVTGKMFQLPQMVAELALEAQPVDGKPGYVRSPYGRRPEVQVSGPDWLHGVRLPCPETGRTFSIPGNIAPLIARVVQGMPGQVYTPYAVDKKITVKHKQWVPGELVTCTVTKRIFQMPADLPVWQNKSIPWKWVVILIAVIVGIWFLLRDSDAHGDVGKTKANPEQQGELRPQTTDPPVKRMPGEQLLSSLEQQKVDIETLLAAGAAIPEAAAKRYVGEIRDYLPFIANDAEKQKEWISQFAQVRLKMIQKLGQEQESDWKSLDPATEAGLKDYLAARVINDPSAEKKASSVVASKRQFVRAVYDYQDVFGQDAAKVVVELHDAAAAGSAWAKKTLQKEFVAKVNAQKPLTIADPINPAEGITLKRSEWVANQAFAKEMPKGGFRYFKLPAELPQPVKPSMVIKSLVMEDPSGIKLEGLSSLEGAGEIALTCNGKECTARFQGGSLILNAPETLFPENSQVQMPVSISIPGWLTQNANMILKDGGGVIDKLTLRRETGRLHLRLPKAGMDYPYLDVRWVRPLTGSPFSTPPAGGNKKRVVRLNTASDLDKALPTGVYELTLAGDDEKRILPFVFKERAEITVEEADPVELPSTLSGYMIAMPQSAGEVDVHGKKETLGVFMLVDVNVRGGEGYVAFHAEVLKESQPWRAKDFLKLGRENCFPISNLVLETPDKLVFESPDHALVPSRYTLKRAAYGVEIDREDLPMDGDKGAENARTLLLDLLKRVDAVTQKYPGRFTPKGAAFEARMQALGNAGFKDALLKSKSETRFETALCARGHIVITKTSKVGGWQWEGTPNKD